MVFSTKSYLVIHDFAIHGFFFPPNTRELRGPPVFHGAFNGAFNGYELLMENLCRQAIKVFVHMMKTDSVVKINRD